MYNSQKMFTYGLPVRITLITASNSIDKDLAKGLDSSLNLCIKDSNILAKPRDPALNNSDFVCCLSGYALKP